MLRAYLIPMASSRRMMTALAPDRAYLVMLLAAVTVAVGGFRGYTSDWGAYDIKYCSGSVDFTIFMQVPFTPSRTGTFQRQSGETGRPPAALFEQTCPSHEHAVGNKVGVISVFQIWHLVSRRLSFPAGTKQRPI